MKRLACDHGRGEAVVPAILVHDPSHHVGIGVDVRAGMSMSGPMTSFIPSTKGPRDALQLEAAHLSRIAIDAAFGPAKGDIDDRGLPRHEIGKGRGVVLVHGGVIAQPALERSPDIIVLNPEAREMHELARIVFLDELDLDHAGRRQENVTDLRCQVEDVSGLVKVAVGFFEHFVRLCWSVSGSHARRSVSRIRALSQLSHDQDRRHHDMDRTG